MFCAECGTFIAVGAKVFSGGAGSSDAAPDRSVVAPLTPGAMSLGAYSAAMRRQAQRRRVLLGMVSVALVAVVGLAALYAATSPRDGGSAPAPAALVAATPTTTEGPTAAEEPTAVARRNVGPAVGAVDLTEVELEPLADPAPSEVEPEPEPPAPAEPVTEPAPEQEAEAQPLPPAQVEVPAETQAEPEAMSESEGRSEPDPVAEPETQAEPQAPAEPEPERAEAEPERAEPRAEETIVWRNGWVCDGELTLQDARLRDWTITRASFLPGNGYERVILQLDRIGSGSGEPASLSAEAFPRTKVAQEVPGVRRPSLGRTAIALQFSFGVKTDLTLRGYRPSGLTTIKELSAYPAGPRGSRVLVSTTTDDGCFRLRAPAWSGSSGAQKAQIVLDVKS